MGQGDYEALSQYFMSRGFAPVCLRKNTVPIYGMNDVIHFHTYKTKIGISTNT